MHRYMAFALSVVTIACAQTDPGRRSYETRCARCHGADATGGEGGPNIQAQIAGRSASELGAFLRVGRPASGMPAFDLPAQEMTDLVAHLRALAPMSRNASPGVVERRVTLVSGETLEGQVLNEGPAELQLRSEDKPIHLLRKSGDRYREVTSQTDWPGYHGDPGGNRYTRLTQVDRSNVATLAPAWIFPMQNISMIENTPVVVDGIMYVSSANECWALDAGSGRQIWHYQRARTKGISGNAGLGFNRGVAWAGDRIFQLTDNAHLLALNRFNGELLWETEMADWHLNYNGTSAPLVVGNLVISGTAGGDEGARGFLAAYDVATGKEAWRVWTVPQAGEPGSETWSGKDVEHRSGDTWMTGTYDAETGTLFWPVGNPGPDFDGGERAGDNLYTDSVLALDPKTGKLKWYFQFTPHDVHDWDAQEPPVVVDADWHGAQRKLLLQANRNGFFYVFDRTNGELLLAKPFLRKLNWADGIGKDGRPILKTLPELAGGETYVCPGFQGGTNWFSTSFNPATGLYYFQALERCNLFSKNHGEWQAGKGYMGGAARPAPGESFQKILRAIDIQTGDIKWEVPQSQGPVTASAGVLSTASGLVFFGENSGVFMAADAANGEILWQFPTNHVWKASPMTYEFDHKQYIAVAAGIGIIAFALRAATVGPGARP
jgi:alcohol dehydrogenase (cytochrome c)